MALGGGKFTSENKVLPGSYINFASSNGAAEILGDRGVVAMPMEMDWGPDGAVFNVQGAEFAKACKKTFGYEADDAKMKDVRELFCHAREVYFYRLLNTGVKASNTYGTAKYKGIRGNEITIIIAQNADDETKYDVTTVFDLAEVETQTVAAAANLQNNDYVDWNTSATLAETAGLKMSGGTNGLAVTGSEYQAALDAFEAYSFNILGCLATDDTIKDTFAAYTKRLRDENGVKFQSVLYKRESADHEGVVSVENTVYDSGALASALVCWVAGALAGTEISQSATNMLYDGEYSPAVGYKQSELEAAIGGGKFMLHSVGKNVRVLRDINTLTTYTQDKGENFANNQTIRVIDQIANDIAGIFNTKYLGLKPNDGDSRISFWNDIVTHHRELETLGAIEDFSADNVTISQGADKKSVVVQDAVTPSNAMEQLYMTVIVQ